MIEFRLTQHPVGQGGFFTGTLKNDDHNYRWVYDCGSNQIDALLREIELLSRLDPIDQFFVSHLDSDHVNGIDYFLSTGCGAKEFVLPYLSDLERMFLLCRESSRGRLTGSFVDFIVDPGSWLSRRNVTRVTFIGGRDDDAPPDDGVPLPVGDPRESGDGPILGEWSKPPSTTYFAEKVQISEILSNASVCMTVGGSQINWILAPYVHRPSEKRFEAFRLRLASLVRGKLKIKKLVDLARSSAGREKLRDCYDVLWADHNIISMTLYSGPIWSRGVSDSGALDVGSGGWYMMRNDQSGWISTGDFQLASRIRRQAFISYYTKLLKLVGIIVLPHHGSALNFHHDVLDSFSSLRAAIAPAGPNSYGHPHSGVRGDVRSKGVQFYKVSHRARSRIATRGSF
jgi:hypothetical protein